MSSLQIFDPFTTTKRDPFSSMTDLMGWTPSSMMGGMMNPFMSSALAPFGNAGNSLWSGPEQRAIANVLSADFIENPHEYRLIVNLPGVHAENLEVELRDQSIVVSGHSDRYHEETEENVIRKERHHGDFTRTFPLPKNCSQDIKTNLYNGVLTVTCPKLARTPDVVRKLAITQSEPVKGHKTEKAKKSRTGN